MSTRNSRPSTPTAAAPADDRPTVGLVGLGDQGLPMARAVAASGLSLHVWARRPAALEGLIGVAHHEHATPGELAAACDVLALCLRTDDDVLDLAQTSLLRAMRPGSVLVNHGTGSPAVAVRLAELGTRRGIEVLDAPVSGGRPAAEQRALTTLVGGGAKAAERCRPVFGSFSRHVVHLGGPGAGQLAKLFNNTLLAMNQANIAEIVELADALGQDPARLIDVLALGSASSAALTLLNTMVTASTVGHLSEVQALDLDIFAAAVGSVPEAAPAAEAVLARGRAGARRLPELLQRTAAAAAS